MTDYEAYQRHLALERGIDNRHKADKFWRDEVANLLDGLWCEVCRGLHKQFPHWKIWQDEKELKKMAGGYQ